jgi:putative exosortase-associated protein (TIGR04073 family)
LTSVATLTARPRIDAIETPSRRRQTRILLTTLAIVSILLVPSAALARDSSARKVGRGFANVTLGVLAIPGEITRTTRSSGPFMGATWGLTKGIGMMVASEVVGVFEILTCPFETPPGFKPILSPEFPWDYFMEEQPRQLTRKRHEPSS